jgi:hypothetical protein
MAIRINLLAEAQAAEEERRKDPVKRAAYAAGLVVFIIVLWASTLQLKILSAKSQINSIDAKWKRIESSYESAVSAQRQAIDAEHRLALLHHMSTNRFLWGNVLNALQQTFNNVNDIQTVRLRAEQLYTIAEETRTRTNGTKITLGKPATSTEKIQMTIDAWDTNPQAGNRVNAFKEALANHPYFKDSLAKTNAVLLTAQSAPQPLPGGGGQFVTFSLQCNFPEKTR